MLGLMQILNYMLTHTEYSDIEIDEAFTAVVNGDETIDSLCYALGIELCETSRQLAQAKVSKWESAFRVLKMQRGA